MKNYAYLHIAIWRNINTYEEIILLTMECHQIEYLGCIFLLDPKVYSDQQLQPNSRGLNVSILQLENNWNGIV